VQSRALRGELMRGRIQLVPSWRRDYCAAVAALLGATREGG